MVGAPRPDEQRVTDQRAADDGFAPIVEALSVRKGVTLGSGRRGFGSDALQIEGHIFAMARAGGLVLKLPAERVAELIAGGDGAAFGAGKGRPMREWVVIDRRAQRRWLALAEEAAAFVATKAAPPG